MGTVATNVSNQATAYGNERKIDRAANGTLVAAFKAGSPVELRSSQDQGATWGPAFATIAAQFNTILSSSIFIDQDDHLHVVVEDDRSADNKDIRYSRGVPNAARTAWSMSAPVTVHVGSAAVRQTPDVVAHREGTGWVAHVVWSQPGSVRYAPVTITSTGTITAGAEQGLGNSGSDRAYPSIDFHHTGDGKTIQGGTPHLYVGWSAGGTGAGLGIRFRRAAYAAGAWTWGTEREIVATSYHRSEYDFLTCMFDGTRAVIAGFLFNAATGTQALALYERDAADTTTTTRALGAHTINDPSFYGTATVDQGGNVYLFGRTNTDPNTTKRVGYRRWARASGTFEPPVPLTTVDTGTPWFSARRASTGGRLDYVRTDGITSPYTVTSGHVQLNTAPTAPVPTAPPTGTSIDRNVTQRLDWDFTDPDPTDTQSRYRLRYKVTTAPAWTEVTAQTPNTFRDFPAGTFTGVNYEWRVTTADSQGVESPESASSFFTAADAPPGPVVTAPTNGATVSSTGTLAWSVPTQDAYQVRRLADTAGAPGDPAVPANVYADTGVVEEPTTRARSLTFETNNRAEHLQVRTRYQGLWSPWSSARVQVSFTRPPVPAVTLLPIDTLNAGSTDALLITITNPAPTTGQPAVVYNDVLVDDGDGETRRATMLPPGTAWTYRLPRARFDYAGRVRVVATAGNGTTATGTGMGATVPPPQPPVTPPVTPPAPTASTYPATYTATYQ